MTAPITSLLAPQVGATLPSPEISELSDDEQALVTGLSMKLATQSVHMLQRIAYYEGTQRVSNLGISVPRQLANVRTVVGWPATAVDPLVERAVVDGFRMPGATDVDTEFQEFWQVNDLDSEASLTFLDSLICGSGYMVVGSPDRPGDAPIITIESPLNLTMNWDPRNRRPTAAYQAYQVEGIYRAVLYLPNKTIEMSHDLRTGWVIDNVDQHNFGDVPVRRFSNRQRSSQREGVSQITPAIMSTTDSAVRTLLGMEVAREFYSLPHRYILGASESDFVSPNGTPKTSLDLSMNKFLALERDESGNLPTIGQFTAYDPSVFTKIIDMGAQLMSAYTKFPPSYFGLTSTANPASADAIRVAENGLVKQAQRCQLQWSSPLEDIMRLAWRFANNGAEVPRDMARLETDWESAETPTPAATTDALFKQASMGSIVSTSDVTLKRLGYSAVERSLLAQDRALDPGVALLAELYTSLGAKEARVSNTVARTINPAAVKAAPTIGPDGQVVAPAATPNVQPPAAGH